MQAKTISKDYDAIYKADDAKDRTYTFVASKEVTDADGDIVRVGGIDLKRFKKNPVILPWHNYAGFPIGKGVGKKAWVEGKQLMIKFELAPEEDSPIAGQAKRLIDGGYLKASSIGFIPDWSEIEEPTKAEQSKGARQVFKKAELLELSLVAVPSNPDALIASIDKAIADNVLTEEAGTVWKNLVEAMECNCKEATCNVIEVVKISGNTKITEDEVTMALDKASTCIADLAGSVEEKNIEIAVLKLKLKEQEMDEEIEESESDYLAGIFALFEDQADSSETEADVEQTDEMTIDDALTILNQGDE